MIHIACNIDSNYVRHCAVTLVSLFENNRAETFTVHILARGLTVKEQTVLTGLAARYGSRVAFYEPDPSLLEGFTIRKFSRRISMATYYRCILSELLPAGVDRLLYLDCDIVVNIQGDEPFTRKEVIEQVLRPFYMEDGDSIDLCTLKEQMDSHEDISNPNNVKVITDISGSALYFSRSPIPYPRDPRSGARWWRHIGIYAFRRQALEMFSRWPMGELEASEKIECLRFLEHGRRIKVVETSGMRVSIDTPEDLAKAERILKGG